MAGTSSGSADSRSIRSRARRRWARSAISSGVMPTTLVTDRRRRDRPGSAGSRGRGPVEAVDRQTPVGEEVEADEGGTGDVLRAGAEPHDGLDHLLERLDLVGADGGS